MTQKPDPFVQRAADTLQASAAQVRRLERRLMSPPAKAARSWKMPLAGALIAVLALVLVLVGVRRDEGSTPQTTVLVERSSERPSTERLDDLPRPQRPATAQPPVVSPVEPSPAAQPVRVYTPKSNVFAGITVSGGGRWAVDASDPSALSFDLAQGTVRLQVDPPNTRQVIVKAGPVSVYVTGTVFSVTRAGGDVAVFVERGEVEIHTNAGRERLSSGRIWSYSQ